VNRFWGDFASSLVGESPARRFHQELTAQACETEEIPGYAVARVLGNGAQSVVYEAVRVETRLCVAVKKLTTARPADGAAPREVAIARALDHPHCLPVLDALPLASGYAVVVPLSPFGSLEISSVPAVTVHGAAVLLRDIGGALRHMHALGVVHRDVKPRNILVFEDRGYTLCDFSISTQLSGDDERVSGVAGTPVFMAPEIAVQKYDPRPCDLWGLGVSVYGLLYGEYPWTLARVLELPDGTLSGQNLAKNEVNGELTFPDAPAVPDEMKEIIAALLEKAPARRMTADALVEHPWLKERVRKWEEMLALLDCE
jgi:serine/threonine protein kinase